MIRALPRILVITDPAYAPEFIVAQLRQALFAVPSGTLAVQVRDRGGRPEALARELRVLTRAHGAMLLVNRDVALAVDIGADGVHFGGEAIDPSARAALGRAAFLTVAAHTDDDVRAAISSGADAALVSPIFETPGKGSPRGANAIVRACAVAPSMPIYALGGVDASNVATCLAAGAIGVAVIRSILGAADPAAAARALDASFGHPVD